MKSKQLYVRMCGIVKSYPESFSLDRIFNLFSSKPRRSAKEVLRGITLNIREGERVGIIGQNGAGKSTLLKIIAGTALPSAGDMDINGSVHAVLTLGVGLREEYTGRENLYLEAEALGKSRSEIELIIEDMIDFSGLGNFIDKPVKTYSSGMKSRLVFSSLVFVEPEILMLDETLATGDQWFQVKARQAIHRLCDRGKIVIVVSHSMESIIDICSRCIWIKDGVVVEDGDPSQVVQKYAEYQRTRVESSFVAPIATERSLTVSDGVAIDSTRFLQLGSEQDPVGIVSGLPLEIEANLRGIADCRSPRVTLTISRADGLLILESQFDIGHDTAGHPISSVSSRIEMFVLAPGLYECVLRVIDDLGERASVARTLRVQSDHVPKGGTPLFLYPILMENLS